jgi:HAD superfamily hydrolase (TIGR01509 family)
LQRRNRRGRRENSRQPPSDVSLQLRPPRAVLFDVGDTLLAERRFDLEAGIASVAGARGEVLALADAFRATVAECHRRQSEPLLAAWLRANVRELALTPVESIEDTVWAAIVTLEPQPGIAMVLRVLAGDGILVGAVSNAAFSGRVMEWELRRHGLADCFRFVLTSADVGSRKPAAGMFEVALARLEVAAADVWFVGDTLEEDIAGARAAGMQPIWLTTQAPETVAVELPTVRSWQEFATLYTNVRARAGQRVAATD